MVSIKPYNPKYYKDLQQVCINTGPLEAATDPVVRDTILTTYCNYYCEVEGENSFALVDENDNAQGYIFSAPDVKKYLKAFRPYLKQLRKINPSCLKEVIGEHIAYSICSIKYPAHLHIDINEGFRGNGNGSRMMDTLLASLREKKVKGVMLIVGSDNARGINFYKKHGFKPLMSVGGGTVMAKEL